ncbi:MAG: glycosyltransferase family 2 protein [Planctomycetota bacterium]
MSASRRMAGDADAGAASDSGEEPRLETTFAVVVNWNGGADDNLRCLGSLVAEGLAPERIIFVDNGSTDGSLEAAAAAFPGLVRLENGENLGFGEASNRGASLALERGASAVAFVNNDLWFVAGESALAGLVAALRGEARLGMVGPRVLFGPEEGSAGPDRVWCSGGRLDFRQNLSTLLGNGEVDGSPWNRSRDVDYIVGAALVVRGQLMEEVGLFEADYFAYMEDVEWGLRAREAGWGVRVIGELRAYHAPSSATGGGYGARRKWMQALNSVRFMRQYGTISRWARFALFDLATLPPLIAWRALKGDARPALAKAKGLWDGFLGRKVTAEAIRPGTSRLWN